jgi:heme-degrading monooxygenase HmoA
MEGKVFVYVWEFIVKSARQREFEKAYGPQGEWVKLFSQGKGYLGTELHQDQTNPMRYITIDYWRSREDRDSFRSTFAREFQRLDALCESFIVQEKFMGDFDCFTNRLPSGQ